MKRIMAMVMTAALLAGCASGNGSSTSEKVKSDLSGYETMKDTEHVFYDMTVQEMVQKMDAGETFTVYFGFETCAWCLEAVPILNACAMDENQEIGYINTRLNPEWTSNLDIDDYDLVVEKLGDHLEYDNDGIRHLYTPHVFFIKDGKVVYDHEGTIEGHNAKETELSEDEKKEVYKMYREGFEALK
ncbi:MAG: hypothetical protein ACI32N_02180 [Bulleidia sp.]